MGLADILLFAVILVCAVGIPVWGFRTTSRRLSRWLERLESIEQKIYDREVKNPTDSQETLVDPFSDVFLVQSRKWFIVLVFSSFICLFLLVGTIGLAAWRRDDILAYMSITELVVLPVMLGLFVRVYKINNEEARASRTQWENSRRLYLLFRQLEHLSTKDRNEKRKELIDLYSTTIGGEVTAPSKIVNDTAG